MNTIVIIRSHSNSNNSLAMPVPGFSENLADSLFQGSAGRPAHSDPSKKRDSDSIVHYSSRSR